MAQSRSASNPLPNQKALQGYPLLLCLVSGGLFFSWIGYLIYLVQNLPPTNAGPVVLSRPQFLISNLDVVAQIDGLNDPVTIVEVFHPEEEKARWIGKKIYVRNLDRCRPTVFRSNEESLLDFRGPGQYILPLRPTGAHPLIRSIGFLATPWAGLGQLSEGLRLKDVISSPVTFDVAPTPPSPGYPRTGFANQRVGPPRIYPAIPATRSQLHAIQKP